MPAVARNRLASPSEAPFVVDSGPTVDVQLPQGPVPVFPLAGLYLFPHQVVPLHIFEPRYRQMIGDLLDGPGRLVLSRPMRGERETPTHAPALQPIGGLGEILRHEKMADGRYMVWILGLGRVQIHEVPSERPYRLVQCALFPEVEVPEADVADLAQELRDATAARLNEPLQLPDEAPPALLADLLLQTIGASPIVLERAFAEPSVLRRARYVLRAAKRQARRTGDDGDDELSG